MKKLIFILSSIFILLFTSSKADAQAFAGKGSKCFTAGLGVGQYFNFGGYYDNYYSHGYYYGYGISRFGYFRPTLVAHANLEFGIHKYIGIAPCVGVGASFYGGSNISLDIPIGAQANFHFLQLIGDKTGKSFADKLDVYAGVNAGGGPSFGFYGNGLEMSGFFYVGPQVGVRYYPKSNIGISAELGYGKTIANVAMVMKLGK